MNGIPNGPRGESFIQIVSLGGKSSENNDIRGACEFVNLNKVSGYHYYFENRTYYYRNINNVPKILCENEKMKIRVQLSKPCKNNPIQLLEKCKSFNYTNVLETIRLALYPM